MVAVAVAGSGVSVTGCVAEASLMTWVAGSSAEWLIVPDRLPLTRIDGVGVCMVDTLLPVGDGETGVDVNDGRLPLGIAERVRRDPAIIKEASMITIAATTRMMIISITVVSHLETPIA
jgi:hypothetical protein